MNQLVTPFFLKMFTTWESLPLHFTPRRTLRIPKGFFRLNCSGFVSHAQDLKLVFLEIENDVNF